MSYRRYARDPAWITVKFDGICARCKAVIKAGTEAFYYPNERKLYCDNDSCGGDCSRDFDSLAQDEAVYQQGAGV